MPVYLRSSVSPTTFETVLREYNKYPCLVDNPDETKVPEAADVVDFYASIEEDLL